MALVISATLGGPGRERSPTDAYAQADKPSDASSAVSWAAIFAGAAGAASLSLILLVPGAGWGLSASPWTHDGKTPFGALTILWLAGTQLVASGLGGYLAGRLRTRWVEVHVDEVYFRDTVHGFLAWAVSSLVTAALLTTVVNSIATSPASSVAGQMGAAVAQPSEPEPALDYFIESMFRRENVVAPVMTPASRAAPIPQAEVSRIFKVSLAAGALPAQDVRHVGQLIRQDTGLPQQDAQQRVTNTFARLQARMHHAQSTATEAAAATRKASAYASLWLFISLLSGAFLASLAATLGGRQRDA
jgi:hypothetical protein